MAPRITVADIALRHPRSRCRRQKALAAADHLLHLLLREYLDAPYAIHKLPGKEWHPKMLCTKRRSNLLYVHTTGDGFSRSLTAMGRRRREEYHFLGRRIQAASLILRGPPVGLRGQIDAPAHYVTRSSC